MGKISQTFATLKAEGKTGLVTYLTAGDPDLETTGLYLKTLEESGVDLLEVGIPFSDPVADGPIIQSSAERALAAGSTLVKILALLSELQLRVPVILFTYYNPVYQLGLDRFAQLAKAAGVDGVLVLDLPPQEGSELRQALTTQGIDNIYLATPTTPLERLAQINASASGAIYYVARMGVTGQTTDFDQPLLERLKWIRAQVDLPLMVGFGIAHPEQIKALKGQAEALVVGSALVQMLADAPTQADALSDLQKYISNLKYPLEEQSHARDDA